MGFEPTTSPVHLFIIFIMAWTISSPYLSEINLGALVSSLYGALQYCIGVPTVFACPYYLGFSLHRYPKEFQPRFNEEAAVKSTGERSNQLSYDRIFLYFSKTSFFLLRERSEKPKLLYIKLYKFKVATMLKVKR